MSDNNEVLTEEEYVARFIHYMVDLAGEDARAYAEEVASSYYDDGYSPEDDVQTDMSYWE